MKIEAKENGQCPNFRRGKAGTSGNVCARTGIGRGMLERCPFNKEVTGDCIFKDGLPVDFLQRCNEKPTFGKIDQARSGEKVLNNTPSTPHWAIRH